MAKTPQTPISRTSRLLDLVPYLAAHQGIELNSLAKDFSVTANQMVADLTTLWMCGLPGYTPLELMDLSFDSGYVTIHNAETLSKPRNLTSEESIALLLGLDLVVQSLPEERSDLLAIATALRNKLAERANLPSPVHANSSGDSAIRTSILHAISAKKSVEISYHSLYADVITSRVITPLEIHIEETHENVWAYCESANSFRSFRMDRVLESKEVKAPARTSHPNHSSESHSIDFVLRIHSRLRDAVERFSINKADMAGDIHKQAYSQQWLIRSVLSSSGTVELIAPGMTRESIALTAATLLRKYETH